MVEDADTRGHTTAGDARMAAFERALRRVMNQLARMMINHGVPIAQGTETLKQALVEAAEQSAEPGKKLTDSRVSMVTGIHRKDVRRLRDESAPGPKRELMGPCALAVGVWSNDPAFLDAGGKPAVLARQATDGSPSFDQLVKVARIDLPPATLLRQLRHDGVVVVNEDNGSVSLVRDAYTPAPKTVAQLEAFALNASTHLAAAIDNLETTDGQPPHFERAAHFNQLSEGSLAQLEDAAKDEARQMLSVLNKLAFELQERDHKEGNAANGRFSVGAYVLTGQTSGKDEQEENV